MIDHPLARTRLKSRLPRAAAICLLALCFAGWLIAYPQHTAPDLMVHEWGTFTAVERWWRWLPSSV